MVVVIVGGGWLLISVLVALAFGGMAKGRDVEPAPMLDQLRAPGPLAPPLRDGSERIAM